MDAVNDIQQDSSPAAIESAAQYAFTMGKSYLQKIKDWPKRSIDGMAILELGPGPEFGAVLTLAAFGAMVAIADRWVPKWQPNFHGPVYTRLAELIEGEFPEADVSKIRELVVVGEHSPDFITIYPDAETLIGAPANTYDLVLSNAVYEHIVDANMASKRVYEVTKPGGWNIHQVDLRDHRDFSRPLEYLLMTKDEETTWLSASEHHQGCQRRRQEYVDAFDAAGFEMLSDYVTVLAEATYMTDFLPKLRGYEGARFQHAGEEEISVLGICFVHRKPS